MSYIYSKLYPKIKSVNDDVTDLVSYINDVKPFHTKIEDVIIQYTFFENIGVDISENYNSIIDFIINYHQDKDGYDVYRYNHEGYDGSQILVQEYYAKGFNEYGYDMEHFDASLNPDYMINDSETTIKTTITEHLTIDTARIKMVGFDYKNYDNDRFDYIDLSILPEVKYYDQPSYLGDIEINPLEDPWGGFDTTIFQRLFSDNDGIKLELILPAFDHENTFNDILTSVEPKILNLENVDLKNFR